MQRLTDVRAVEEGRCDSLAPPGIGAVSATLFARVTLRVRLEVILGRSGRVIHCETINEVRRLFSRQSVTTLYFEQADDRETVTTDLIREVRDAFPSTVIIACSSGRAPSLATVLEMVRSGIDDLLSTDDIERGHTVRRALLVAHQRSMVRVVWPKLAIHFSPIVATVMRYVLERADGPLTLGSVSAALGRNRKTLWTQCQSDGLPAPSTLIGWCRVLAASHALDTPSRTVDSIAYELQFASPSGLRNMLVRFLNVTPTELRRRGATDYAVQRLTEVIRLSRLRHAAAKSTE